MILGYGRISLPERTMPESVSLEIQEQKCNAIAALRGAGPFDMQFYSDDGVSGAVPLERRPAGRDLLAAAKKGDTVVAVKLDRMFRSARDALNTAHDLKEKGIHLVLIDMGTDPVTGKGAAKMFFGMLALVAEFERERIAERLEDGRSAKRAKRGFMGGGVPYGFRVVGSGKTAHLELDSEEQDVIELMVHLRRTHDKRYNHPAGIRRALRNMGCTNRDGNPWMITQIRRILERERNDGRSKHSRDLLQPGCEGSWGSDEPEQQAVGVSVVQLGVPRGPDVVGCVVPSGLQQ